MIKQSEDIMAIQNVTNTINTVCPKLAEPPALLYCFVAIGTLLSLKRRPTLSEQMRDLIELMASNSDSADVTYCCKDIIAILGDKA